MIVSVSGSSGGRHGGEPDDPRPTEGHGRMARTVSKPLSKSATTRCGVAHEQLSRGTPPRIHLSSNSWRGGCDTPYREPPPGSTRSGVKHDEWGKHEEDEERDESLPSTLNVSRFLPP